MEIHVNEQPYKCPFCEFITEKVNGLKIHIKAKHFSQKKNQTQSTHSSPSSSPSTHSRHSTKPPLMESPSRQSNMMPLMNSISSHPHHSYGNSNSQPPSTYHHLQTSFLLAQQDYQPHQTTNLESSLPPSPVSSASTSSNNFPSRSYNIVVPKPRYLQPRSDARILTQLSPPQSLSSSIPPSPSVPRELSTQMSPFDFPLVPIKDSQSMSHSPKQLNSN